MRKTVTVDFPDYGFSVILRQLKAGHYNDIADKKFVDRLALMIVDEKGDRIYKTLEDIASLAEMPSPIADRLATEIQKLNGTSPEAAEETIKNSEASPGAASASA